MISLEETVNEMMDGKSIEQKINYLKDMLIQLTRLMEIMIDNLPDDISEKIIDETQLLETRN